MGKGQGTPHKPVSYEEVEQGPCLAERVGARQAEAGDAGDAEEDMANTGFIHPCPEVRLPRKSPFW